MDTNFVLLIVYMLSVGIWSAYEIMRPALYLLISRGAHEDPLVQHKFISYFVMTCIGALTAPFMVVIILVPYLHDSVIEGIVEYSE